METKHAIRAFVVEAFLMGDAAAPLDDRASLLEQGVLDSTGVLELVGFLERSYGIEVALSEMIPENLDSIEAIAAYVQRKQRG